MKKRLQSLLALLLPVTIVFAQDIPFKITGSVTDSSTSKPVAHASVVYNKSGLGTTTGSDGTFSIPNLTASKYTLIISYIGYRTKTIDVILTSDQPAARIGTIKLQPLDGKLDDVTVVSQKALVEDKGDRLVYNAEKDISNATGTAADVFRKVPNLTVDLNGNVQMRGSSNIKILINGKPSAMMARNLAEALKQLPGNLIRSVEVITSPGAKYDAEGSAGVINIITKKGLQGFNGSVNASLGNFGSGLGTRLSMTKKKVGVSLSVNGYQNRNVSESRNVRTILSNGNPVNILTQETYADNTGIGGYGDFSLDYDPDSSSRINLSANVWGGDYPSNNTMFNKLTGASGAVLQNFRTERKFNNPYGNGQIDLGYTKSFKPEQELSLLSQFSRMPDNYFYDIENYSAADAVIFTQHSTNYSRNKEYTIQTDYTHPLEVKARKDTLNIKLEVGIKSIFRDIGSEFKVEQSLDGVSPSVPDPSQSNDFDYTQSIYSGYTSIRIDSRTKWALTAGLRYEHTNIKGNFRTTQTLLDQQYTNVIPNIVLSKKINSSTYKLSYNQRIQRPLIWYLNPWVNSSDPKNIQTGNPDLQPELNHGLELGYNLSTSKGFSLNSALYRRYTNNAITYVSLIDSADVLLTLPLNTGKREILGWNTNLSGKLNKNWQVNGGGDISYVSLDSRATGLSNDGITYRINANSMYKLPKDYTIQASGGFSSGWIALQVKSNGYYWYGFSAKKEMMDKKASLNLGLNNPFNRGVKQKRDEFGPSYYGQAQSLYVSRSVRLSFEWRFGQMGSGGSKQSKKIANDDAGR